MMDLIARLEAATEGSRELDRLIWLSLPAHRIYPIREVGGHTHERWVDGEDVRWPVKITNFTTSLDAALALVPEKWTAWHVRSRRRKTAFIAELSRLSDDLQNETDEHIVDGRGPSPALAICIASLRARTALARALEDTNEK